MKVWTIIFLWSLTWVATAGFKIGQTVVVGFPANNIKDDAYIIGQIRAVAENGDYQVHVQDYVAGHDYGVSCEPIITNDALRSDNNAWEMWQDKTQLLMVEGVDYLVPGENVEKLSTGKLRFIERYNVYISFSRWKSNAPVLPVEKLEMSKRDAIDVDMEAMSEAFDIAMMDRLSFYEGNIGRPYWPYETIPHINKTLGKIIEVLAADPEMAELWRAKRRDWDKIETNQRWYFTIEAIDHAIENARYQLLEDLEKASQDEIERYKQNLSKLGVKF